MGFRETLGQMAVYAARQFTASNPSEKTFDTSRSEMWHTLSIINNLAEDIKPDVDSPRDFSASNTGLASEARDRQWLQVVVPVEGVQNLDQGSQQEFTDKFSGLTSLKFDRIEEDVVIFKSKSFAVLNNQQPKREDKAAAHNEAAQDNLVQIREDFRENVVEIAKSVADIRHTAKEASKYTVPPELAAELDDKLATKPAVAPKPVGGHDLGG